MFVKETIVSISPIQYACKKKNKLGNELLQILQYYWHFLSVQHFALLGLSAADPSLDS